MPLPVNNYDRDELKCLYNHDLVITLDELPDIKAQAAGNDALASPRRPHYGYKQPFNVIYWRTVTVLSTKSINFALGYIYKRL